MENLSMLVKSLFKFQEKVFQGEKRVLTRQALHLWLTCNLQDKKKSGKKTDQPMLFI